MKSHEAIQRSIASKTVEHAKRLRMSTSMVNKWQEPSADFTDSGALNPLDRIEIVMETAISLGTPREEALAPIQYLAERFNIITIPVPKKTSIAMEALSKELLRAITEFGELSQEASKSMCDDRITRREADRIEKEAWDLIRQVAVFIRTVNGYVK